MNRAKYIARQPPDSKIRRLLIANRGEIAQRIIRTCDLLGIESVAIYTKQDETTTFWRAATISHYAGDLEREGNPYTNASLLIQIAKQSGADAVHPGYGYLSENAEFAQSVIEADLSWVGPRAETIALLGDKAACKQFLREKTKGAVPLIPGVTSRSQDPTFLLSESDRIGYPVLLKASAGGGGKGMRVVESKEDFAANLETAKSEALRSFGSEDMLLEKYLPLCKHVEVQMFGDGRGGSVLFGDRECSVQRRHQKVIEECPAIISQKLKNRMAEAARSIAKVTQYSNAATIEFIVDIVAQEAYFLEVNTRIQVEHPVTEEVYGVDLVALQLYIAAGGDLTSLPAFSPLGHSIELRLYAEDPYMNFMPQRGLVTYFKASSLPARYESSVQTGDSVSINFDPMMAKIIVSSHDRASAITKAHAVIQSTVCLGLQTNQDVLQKCLISPSFKDASYTTSFIEVNLQVLLARKTDLLNGTAIVSALLRKARRSPSEEPNRLPYHSVDVITTPTKTGYYVKQVNTVNHDDDEIQVLEITPVSELPKTLAKSALNEEGSKLVSRYYDTKDRSPERSSTIKLTNFARKRMPTGHLLMARALIDKTSCTVLATVHPSADGVQVIHLDRYGTFTRKSALVGFGGLDTRQALGASGTNDYTAPMPGRVIRIDAKDGATVKLGQCLLALESMKTEVRILARTAGVVKVLVRDGAVVDEGTVLAAVKQDDEADDA